MKSGDLSWKDAQTFRFLSANYTAETGQARLSYALEDPSGHVTRLAETITFPYSPWPPEPSRQEALQQALRLLHLIAGVSYYKSVVPHEMKMDGKPIDRAIADFLNDLYIKGLAEFAFCNDIDLNSLIDFGKLSSMGADRKSAAQELVLPDRALVAMGGGKDSLVALTLLQEKGLEVQPVCVGESRLIGETVRAAGLPLLRIGRELDPLLSDMNRQGAFNGHVPVTAINSAILLCAAILYGYRKIVFANERSADEATLTGDSGIQVNHQYSKTTEFEAGFRDLIQCQVSPDIEYFSILRPYSELAIVGRFSELEQYHQVFSSCNRNFHLDGSRNEGRWCGDCPKCRFTALALAVFLPPEKVVAIQGSDLLDSPKQIDGIRALCRLGRDKPFECVGESGECRAALRALASKSAWQNHAVVRALAPELEGVEVPPLESVISASEHHFIPAGLAPDEKPGRPDPDA